MIDKVTKALEAKHAHAALESVDIKVPSESYVGMQFAPKNKSTTNALAFAGMRPHVFIYMRIVAYMLCLCLLHFCLLIYLYNYVFIYCWRVSSILGIVHKVQQKTMRFHHEHAHNCANNWQDRC